MKKSFRLYFPLVLTVLLSFLTLTSNGQIHSNSTVVISRKEAAIINYTFKSLEQTQERLTDCKKENLILNDLINQCEEVNKSLIEESGVLSNQVKIVLYANTILTKENKKATRRYNRLKRIYFPSVVGGVIAGAFGAIWVQSNSK